MVIREQIKKQNCENEKQDCKTKNKIVKTKREYKNKKRKYYHTTTQPYMIVKKLEKNLKKQLPSPPAVIVVLFLPNAQCCTINQYYTGNRKFLTSDWQVLEFQLSGIRIFNKTIGVMSEGIFFIAS